MTDYKDAFQLIADAERQQREAIIFLVNKKKVCWVDKPQAFEELTEEQEGMCQVHDHTMGYFTGAGNGEKVIEALECLGTNYTEETLSYRGKDLHYIKVSRPQLAETIRSAAPDYYELLNVTENKMYTFGMNDRKQKRDYYSHIVDILDQPSHDRQLSK